MACTPSPDRSGFEARRSGDPETEPLDARRTSRVDQQVNIDPPAAPEDARKATQEQRELQEKLEHQDDERDAPGLHQSRHDVADETTR
jgi:hypothetical protein